MKNKTKVIALVFLISFSAICSAQQKPMAGNMDMKPGMTQMEHTKMPCGMDMKQCMNMEQCKGMMDHSKMADGMDMKQCMKMEQCKGMMDHKKMSGGMDMKPQTNKKNNVFE